MFLVTRATTTEKAVERRSGAFSTPTANVARLRQADRGGTGAIDFSEFLSAVVGNLVSLSA
jgi:hypothetical protein